MPDCDAAAQLLAASPDHRVLRRVPPVERWVFPEAIGEVVRAAIVDVETTGLDERDEVIELAIVPFEYDRLTGKVVRVLKPYTSFRQPSIAIPDASTRVHGITWEMVAGHVIEQRDVSAALEGAQIIIAHHAGFDRPMLERHWPMFETYCFGCSYVDVDWRGEGQESSKLKYLLNDLGWFHDGHRAADDAMATLFLLTQTLPTSAKPALRGLLERARRPLYILQADNTDFDQRGCLKVRGYGWKPITSRGEKGPKAWLLATSEPDAEIAWLQSCEAWTRNSRLALRAVPARLRYSHRTFEVQGGA